jgi:hypothetical protein
MERELKGKEMFWSNETWKATGRKRIGQTLPLNNGRRTKLPDFIEFENKEGTKVEIHPTRILWTCEEKKKPKREHKSKREKRNERKNERNNI